MQESLVRDIAQQVVSSEILSSWRYYVLILLLTLLGSAVGAFIVTYLRRRAENFATKTDFEELLRQVEKTTETAEQVKAAVQHSDWSAREWKTLRRVKLEEAVLHAQMVEHWFDSFRGRWLFDRNVELPPSPADRVVMLATLYFPELEVASSRLALSCSAACSWVLDVAKEITNVGNDAGRRAEILRRRVPEWAPLHRAIIEVVREIRDQAGPLAKQIAGA